MIDTNQNLQNISKILGIDNDVDEIPYDIRLTGSGIYKITNLSNKKVYIGQTKDFLQRLRQYRTAAKHPKRLIEYLMKELGYETFDIRLIYECEPKDLTKYELYFIEKYKSYLEDFGYNVEYLGYDGGMKISEEIPTMKFPKPSNIPSPNDARRNKSNVIYALKDDVFIICDSAALFGKFVGKSKDLIKNGLRNPSKICGYRLYYADSQKREAIKYHKLTNHRGTRKSPYKDPEYFDVLNYIDNSSVETIEKDFNVIYMTYENFEEASHRVSEVE